MSAIRVSVSAIRVSVFAWHRLSPEVQVLKCGPISISWKHVRNAVFLAPHRPTESAAAGLGQQLCSNRPNILVHTEVPTSGQMGS